MAGYQLVMKSGPAAGKAYPMTKAEVYIGRDPNCEVVINDPEVSRRHSRLSQQGSVYTIEDLGSTNGTFINGQRLMGPYTLKNGDMVTLGEKINLLYEASGGAAEATLIGGQPASTPAYGGYPPPMQRAPAPEPAAPPPPRQAPRTPAYVNQIPESPEYEAAPEPEKRFPTLWVIVGIIVFLLLCVCCAGSIFFLWVDNSSKWCDFFAPVMNIIQSGWCPVK